MPKMGWNCLTQKFCRHSYGSPFDQTFDQPEATETADHQMREPKKTRLDE